MTSSADFTIECNTCIAAGTTACNGCLVMHVLANDDGPVDYLPVRLAEVPRTPDAHEVAVELFVRAGLLDSHPQYVSLDQFESYGAAVHV